ncbi:unnamed protein product [Trichogramma brassicae]|uniref:Uncharacterized protein n=1 Tax=Trichogramma brassicae TaxID=86971 RepID=A0A6H5I5A7_9HYME|nr:unnamed protein product [Trichogramma brassicae]
MKNPTKPITARPKRAEAQWVQSEEGRQEGTEENARAEPAKSEPAGPFGERRTGPMATSDEPEDWNQYEMCAIQPYAQRVGPSISYSPKPHEMSRRSSALAVTHKGFYCGHAQSVCTGATSAGKRIGGTAGGQATVPDVTTEAREASEGESDEEDLLEHVIWVPEENDEAAEDMAWESGSAEKEDQAQETDRSKKGAKEFSRQQTSQLIAVNVARRAEENAASAVPTGEHNPEIPEIAGMCQENRHYAKFSIGGQEYIAFARPGGRI